MSDIDLAQDSISIIGEPKRRSLCDRGICLSYIQDAAHRIQNHLEHGFWPKACFYHVCDGLPRVVNAVDAVKNYDNILLRQ